jgi:hypothetical protein
VASFPRNLAIPQLLRSQVMVILPLAMRNLTTVFTHGGLSPRQVTPSQAHTRRCTEGRPPDAAWRFGYHGGAAIGELKRHAKDTLL